jgi:SAM-dependent methyltransferase
LWEYGSVVAALLAAFGEDLTGRRVIDVGGGAGPLGPTLALRYGCDVLDIDPSPNVAPVREPAVSLLSSMSHHYTFQPTNLFDVAGTYDGVFCISVMEHLPVEEQEAAWRKLASLVAPGGVLVATVDYGEPGVAWKNDDCRDTKIGPEELGHIVSWLEESGIELTDLDPTYHGAYVFDYTFFRLVGMRSGSPAEVAATV